MVDEHAQDEVGALLEAGFVASRRESVVEFALDDALEALGDVRMPAGVVIRSAADVDVDRLRLLDNELRDDVPGTSGWRSSPEEFHANTFDDPAFDSNTYLIAVDAASGDYVGLVRVWMNRPIPRAGMVGVVRPYRNRGIASALLAQALRAARSTGASTATAEFDVTNGASRALLQRLGAREIGATIEFSYRP